MTGNSVDPASRILGLKRLRREILGARVTVALDEETGHETPPPVKRLANMKLPTAGEMAQVEFKLQSGKRSPDMAKQGRTAKATN